METEHWLILTRTITVLVVQDMDLTLHRAQSISQFQRIHLMKTQIFIMALILMKW